MTFTVFHKLSGKEVEPQDLYGVAEEIGLMWMDIGEFMFTESGTLILSDDCGNIGPIPKEGKYIIDICIDGQGTIVKIDY